MFKLPEFPAVDFTKFDLAALRDFDISKYVPAVNFPKLDMPNVELPAIDVDKLTAAVRDAAYVSVGIGAAALEQAQARRRELAANLADGFEATKIHVDTVVDKIEAMLPDKAAALLGQAREMSESASNQFLGLFRSAA